MRKLCPGQDTRFWKPQDIYEVRCAGCSTAVEFFKDDISRPCPSCGRRIRNPKFNPGCAQWCEHARECLGFDPNEQAAASATAGESLSDRLIDGLKKISGGDPDKAAHALSALEAGRNLLETEKADPRIVAAAVLFFDYAGNGAGEEKVAGAARAMEEAGMHWSEILEVKKILASLPGESGCAEARIAAEALRLSREEIRNPGNSVKNDGDSR